MNFFTRHKLKFKEFKEMLIESGMINKDRKQIDPPFLMILILYIAREFEKYCFRKYYNWCERKKIIPREECPIYHIGGETMEDIIEQYWDDHDAYIDKYHEFIYYDTGLFERHPEILEDIDQQS